MDDKPYKTIAVSRPTDKPLEAYKAWIKELAKQVQAGGAEVKWSDEEWVANWKKFWKEKPSG